MEEILYGLLSYNTNNVGDEIQSLAARQFLPRVDLYIDRDNLKYIRSGKKIKLVLNGWFNPTKDNWPPSEDIEPLFISFHVSRKAVKEFTSSHSLAYLKKHQPIGCRDMFTKKILEENGIRAYFSGCLTLTFKNTFQKKSGGIVVADLEKEAVVALPEKLRKEARYTEHWSYPQYTRKGARFFSSHLKIFRLALRILKINNVLWFFLKITKNRGGHIQKG